MNKILFNIISVLVTMVILPLISFAGIKLIAQLNAEIKDENAKTQLTTAIAIVTNSVRSVFQTYVDTLKKNGTFDVESLKIALAKAKDEALSQMSDEIKEYITTNYGNLENWLTTQIEATINILKNNYQISLLEIYFLGRFFFCAYNIDIYTKSVYNYI